MKEAPLPPLLSEPTNGRIQDALYAPDLFARRERRESIEQYHARAIAQALHFDDEELAARGLGVKAMPGRQPFTPTRTADSWSVEPILLATAVAALVALIVTIVNIILQ